MAETDKKTDAQAEPKKQEPRKKLAEAFEEPIAIDVSVVRVHQAVEHPKMLNTGNTFSAGRPGLRDLRMRYHPAYGLIFNIGELYLATAPANVVSYI